MNHQKLVVVIEGSSGVGKSTIMDKLMEGNKEIKKIVSYTSRPKRENETDGKDYYFVTPQKFEDMIKNNEFLEHDTIHGIYKGIGKDFVEKSEKHNIFIKEMTLDGLFNVKKSLTHHHVLGVFITEKKSILKKRLLARGEKDWKKRLKIYNWQQKTVGVYDYVVVNRKLDVCVEQINTIIENNKINKNLIPLLSTQKLNDKKVQKYINKIDNGKSLKPITVAVANNKIYIVNGAHRYLASLRTNAHLLKHVLINYSFCKDELEEKEWEKIINSYSINS